MQLARGFGWYFIGGKGGHQTTSFTYPLLGRVSLRFRARSPPVTPIGETDPVVLYV